jgi:hypothetical protein
VSEDEERRRVVLESFEAWKAPPCKHSDTPTFQELQECDARRHCQREFDDAWERAHPEDKRERLQAEEMARRGVM